MKCRLLVMAAFAALLSAPIAGVAKPNSRLHYGVVGRIAGADGGWDFATVDAPNGKLYVARSNAIMAVDLASRKVTDTVATARRAHQILIIPGSDMLLETDGETNLARFVSTKDGAVLAEVPVGTKPDAAFFDEATGLVAVMNADDGTISLIDAKSKTLTGSIKVGGTLEFGVSNGRGTAYVNVEDKNEIAIVDLTKRQVIGAIALPGCEGPTGLALVGAGKNLISACANGKALVINLASGKAVAALPIGLGPDAVLVDAKRSLAFIPCGGSGTLVAISTSNAAHMTVAATIVTQAGAKTGAIDPRDGHIYLPTATIAAPEPGAKRGKPVPGSFVILVVSPHS
jgi:DNA-binding beta-propeller fold protein YncE